LRTFRSSSSVGEFFQIVLTNPSAMECRSEQDTRCACISQFAQVPWCAHAAPDGKGDIRNLAASGGEQGAVGSGAGADAIEGEQDGLRPAETVQMPQQPERLHRSQFGRGSQEATDLYIHADQQPFCRISIANRCQAIKIRQSLRSDDGPIHAGIEQPAYGGRFGDPPVNPQLCIQLGGQLPENGAVITNALDGIEVGDVERSAVGIFLERSGDVERPR
jgi:hypothetical protein